MFGKKQFLGFLVLNSLHSVAWGCGRLPDTFDKSEEGTAFSPVSVSPLSTPKISTPDLAYLEQWDAAYQAGALGVGVEAVAPGRLRLRSKPEVIKPSYKPILSRKHTEEFRHVMAAGKRCLADGCDYKFKRTRPSVLETAVHCQFAKFDKKGWLTDEDPGHHDTHLNLLRQAFAAQKEYEKGIAEKKVDLCEHIRAYIKKKNRLKLASKKEKEAQKALQAASLATRKRAQVLDSSGPKAEKFLKKAKTNDLG